MSDIDWTKPVETHSGDLVVASFLNPNGSRHVVIKGKGGEHYGWLVRDNELACNFRNMPEPEPDPPAIDWLKPVECRASRGDWWAVKSRVIHRKGYFVVVVECPDDGSLQLWTEQGRTFRNVRRKVKHECWLNLYEGGDMSVHKSQRSADFVTGRPSSPRVECRHIQWEVEIASN